MVHAPQEYVVFNGQPASQELVLRPLCRTPPAAEAHRWIIKTDDLRLARSLARAALASKFRGRSTSAPASRMARRLGYAAARRAARLPSSKLLLLAQWLRADHVAPHTAARCGAAALRLPGHSKETLQREAIEWSLWMPLVGCFFMGARSQL